MEPQGTSCVVEAIYNPRLSPTAIFYREALGEAQITRIKNRVKSEIFARAKVYARDKGRIQK